MTDASDNQPESKISAIRWIVGEMLGGGTYLITNVLVFMFAGGGSSDDRQPPVGAALLIALTVGVLVLSVRNRDFRPFGVGFVAFFVIVSLFSGGNCTFNVDNWDPLASEAGSLDRR